MSKSATKVLEGGGELGELRVHEFEDDESAQDDAVIEQLYAECSGRFDDVIEALSNKYGKPSRTGSEDDEAIPLGGVFRFAIWVVDDRQLFVAAVHEDRGVPDRLDDRYGRANHEWSLTSTRGELCAG